MKKTLIITAALAFCLDLNLRADTAIQLSLTPDVALYSRDTTVHGLSLSIWGENQQTGLAVGFVNGSTGDSSGFSWGLFNYDESYQGVQWGAVNASQQSFVGWQDGFVNIARGTFQGYQSGLVNYSEDTTGFQLGAINYAQKLNGVQIGFLNVAMNNGWFNQFPNQLATGFPIINWSF